MALPIELEFDWLLNYYKTARMLSIKSQDPLPLQ